MILRAGQDGSPEVFMVKRPGAGDFPDLHVFPGGKLDADDWQPELCPDITDAVASQRLGISAGGVRYWVAVARECFEECGVLLARNVDHSITLSQEARQAVLAARPALLAGEVEWSALLQQFGLTIAADRIVYFSHWLTPPSVPRRFDTRFFLAALPEGQAAMAGTDETISGQWIAPGRALERYRSGQWRMIDPTLRSLEVLADFPSVEQALGDVAGEQHVKSWTPALGRQGMQPFR